MIKNENRMLADEIIGVSEMSLGDCFRLGKDTIDAPVLSAKTREREGDVRGRCDFRANESDATRVEKSMEKMVAEKVKEVVSSKSNMTISGSMDKLVLEEEKKPQYRVNKIIEAVVGANEGWY